MQLGLWPVVIDGPTLHVCGASRGAWATGFYVKELNLALDAGQHCPFVPRVLCVTHSHSDHTNALYPMLLDSNQCRIYTPLDSASSLRAYLAQARSYHHGLTYTDAEFETNERWPVQGVLHGDVWPLVLHPSWSIHVHALQHDVPCMGFGIWHEGKRLRPMFQGKAANELRDLRKQGADIEERVDVPVLGYFTDTGIEPLRFSESLWRYPTMMVECTWIGAPNEVTHSPHIAWPNLEPLVQAHPQTQVYLIHLSSRYGKEEIEAFVQKATLCAPNVHVIY